MFLSFSKKQWLSTNGKLIRNEMVLKVKIICTFFQLKEINQRIKFIKCYCLCGIRYQYQVVAYSDSLLSNCVPRGIGNGTPQVKLPQPSSWELQRIRLYDTVNIDTIFFVISELQEASSPLSMMQQCLEYWIIFLEWFIKDTLYLFSCWHTNLDYLHVNSLI